jgi:hypothetical protein
MQVHVRSFLIGGNVHRLVEADPAMRAMTYRPSEPNGHSDPSQRMQTTRTRNPHEPYGKPRDKRPEGQWCKWDEVEHRNSKKNRWPLRDGKLNGLQRRVRNYHDQQHVVKAALDVFANRHKFPRSAIAIIPSIQKATENSEFSGRDALATPTATDGTALVTNGPRPEVITRRHARSGSIRRHVRRSNI